MNKPSPKEVINKIEVLLGILSQGIPHEQEDINMSNKNKKDKSVYHCRFARGAYFDDALERYFVDSEKLAENIQSVLNEECKDGYELVGIELTENHVGTNGALVVTKRL